MIKRVVVKSRAKHEILRAQRWYENQRKGLGSRFANAVLAKLDVVAAHPATYAVVYLEFRRASVEGFPYAIFFRDRPQFIDIVAVMHTSRGPDEWKKIG